VALGNDKAAHTCRDQRTSQSELLDMRVIFMDISAGQGGLSSVEMEARRGGCRSLFGPVR
jgi:hypothetical protein